MVALMENQTTQPGAKKGVTLTTERAEDGTWFADLEVSAGRCLSARGASEREAIAHVLDLAGLR